MESNKSLPTKQGRDLRARKTLNHAMLRIILSPPHRIYRVRNARRSCNTSRVALTMPSILWPKNLSTTSRADCCSEGGRGRGWVEINRFSRGCRAVGDTRKHTPGTDFKKSITPQHEERLLPYTHVCEHTRLHFFGACRREHLRQLICQATCRLCQNTYIHTHQYFLRQTYHRVQTFTNASVYFPPLCTCRRLFIGQPVSAGNANGEHTHTRTHTRLHLLEPLDRDGPELVEDDAALFRRKGEGEIVPRDLLRKRLHKVLPLFRPSGGTTTRTGHKVLPLFRPSGGTTMRTGVGGSRGRYC